MTEISHPGLHWKTPIIVTHAEVQTTVQTDSVSNIPCGTSGGVMVTFAKVEVVNRLKIDLARETVANYSVHYDKLWIFDKVHHEINQFCSKHTLHEVSITLFDQLDEQLANSLKNDCSIHAPGIDIIAVRMTKPSVPDNIRVEFEKREAAIAALQVAEQRRLVEAAQADTEAQKKRIEAQRDADVAAINSKMEVAQQEAEQKKEAIRDEMHKSHERALADAEAYTTEKRAKANQALLSPQYLELKRYENIAANTKIYFGSKIPTALGLTASGAHEESPRRGAQEESGSLWR